MKIKFPSKKLNGVTAYAEATSSDKLTKYLVVKQKTADGGVSYRCSCENYLFRGSECRHISEFKKAWSAVTRK